MAKRRVDQRALISSTSQCFLFQYTIWPEAAYAIFIKTNGRCYSLSCFTFESITIYVKSFQVCCLLCTGNSCHTLRIACLCIIVLIVHYHETLRSFIVAISIADAIQLECIPFTSRFTLFFTCYVGLRVEMKCVCVRATMTKQQEWKKAV